MSFKSLLNKLYRKVMSHVEYTTRTPARFNQAMTLSKAHGIIVVRDFPKEGMESIVPFQVEDPAKLEYPSERLIKDLIQQAWLLGYQVRSLEFTVGTRKNTPFLFDTYFMLRPSWQDKPLTTENSIIPTPLEEQFRVRA